MAKKENLANELSKLYNKAKTQKDYEKVVMKGDNSNNVNLDNVGSADSILLILLPSFWAEYYLSLKFPLSSVLVDEQNFLHRVQNTLSRLKNPNNKVALLYLESVIWSNLLNDQERAGQLTDKMNRIIASESVSLTSILRLITSRIIKEMADENWTEAVKISKEIEVFPREILRHAENLRHTANIFNNWGASLIRGNIDVDKGREKLLVAKDYYLREEVLPEGHLEGIENRLREADEKS